MNTTNQLKVRVSIIELQNAYTNGNKKPLEDLMRAWKGIKELSPTDLNSFFMLGGFHGEPFRGAGWGNSAYWGGYCNHGNVLFPTWHRVYLYQLELALQSIPGCKDVMLPYWDETNEESLKNGIPWALTDEFFTLDGVQIPNPLRSFVFPQNITDNINGDNPNYSKPYGYETVRYPLSGLVGSEQDRKATAAHNAKFPNYDENVSLLNANVVNWLNNEIIIDGKNTKAGQILKKFQDCLEAPNFTVFSNTTSAAEWNSKIGNVYTTPLESPHNSVHLAVGGFDVPGQGDLSEIPGANGDMGENDTAGLDPIFYFHHCNVDRMFWVWQKKHGYTDSLDIIPEYPGTNTVDSQGPTPGMVPNSWLTLESPLNPFKKENGDTFNSLDCINIEKQLGFTYSIGSLDTPATDKALLASRAADYSKLIKVSNINRAPIRGSFLISAFAVVDGERKHIGTEAVLSRWDTKYCANCQTHLEVKAFFQLPVSIENTLKSSKNTAEQIEVEVKGRDGLLSGNINNKLLKSDGKPALNLKIEVV